MINDATPQIGNKTPKICLRFLPQLSSPTPVPARRMLRPPYGMAQPAPHSETKEAAPTPHIDEFCKKNTFLSPAES